MEVSDSDSSSDDFEKPKQKNKPVESLGGEKSNSDSITAKVKKLYKCQHCSSTFKKKSNCSRHASICSSNKEKASHGFICDICKACYNRKDNLSAHRKTCGASKPSCSSTKVTRKRKPCLIKGCDLEFVHYISLIEHLRSCHQGDVTIKPMVSRTFLSIKEFNVWKEKEEVDTFSYFTKRRGERESAVQHFYCQHDGSAKLHSNRLTSRCNLKNRVKVGHHCIAKMIARVDPETKGVHLEYHPTHTHLCKSEDLLHHPLPDDMSRFINQKLAEHIPPTVVYELTKARFLPKTDVTSINPRANILTKKRILERGRRIRMARRLHKDDARAVFLMVNQFIECDNSILLYKPYGSSVQHGPKEIDHLPDSRQLFMLGIQTQRQLEIFKKFCSKIVILDETHGTNQYKYQLLTAMVVDENRRGWPIAHLITSKSDGPTLQYFFKTLKARLGNEAKIGCVITDDDSALIGGMNAGFSEQLKHILCIWHVFKNLKENVRTKASKSLFDNILSEVKLLMNVKEENMFKKLSNGFVKKYKNSEEAVEFVNYFNKYYLNRCEKWAMCYRNFPHAEVNTTGHIESFHSRLKKFYLKRKVNKRLDDLIHILLDVEWDDHCTRLRESTIGFSTLPQQILQRHQRGLLMDDDSIVENCLENTWEVKSATGKSLSYVIVRHKEMCSSDHCFSKCTKLECHGLCAHLFSCSCADRHPICKHIHKLQSFLTRGQPNVGVQEADFYTLQSTKNNSDFTIEDENHECQHNEEAIPEENNGRKWDSMILRLKDNFSCLEKFIIAAEQKQVPEHTVIHADALLTDLVRGLGPLDLPCNENPVTDIPQMTPAIKFTPNETLKTQLSQLSSFKRPQKRKAKSDLFSLSEKKKNAMESLLMCAEDGNRNSDNDIPDSQVSVDEYDSFTLSYTYVPDPFDNVLTCGEEKISLLHLKALELELPHEEKEMILERDPSFTCGLVPPCIINVFALQLCEQFEHVSYLSSHFARSAARGDSNVELLREHLSKQIIIVSANFSDNHWFVLAIMLEEQAIRLYDPMYKPLSSEIIHCLSQIVSDLKVLYPLIPMWKIKVVNLHEQKVDEIYSGEKICNFIEETVCGKPNIAMVPPCFNFRKHLYSVIVGNCMKRMSFSEEACGKCGRPYNEISHDQDIWTSCLRCQQWFHEACLQRNNSGYFICP